MLEDFLNTQLSVRQLLFTALTGAVLAAIPYLAIGLYWMLTHGDHLDNTHGADKFFSVIGEIVAWPILLFTDIQLR